MVPQGRRTDLLWDATVDQKVLVDVRPHDFNYSREKLAIASAVGSGRAVCEGGVDRGDVSETILHPESTRWLNAIMEKPQ
jgi:hypothetical protein